MKNEIKNLGGDSHHFVGDITNNDVVKKMFDELKSHYGKLDICINSAGTAKFGSIENFSKNEFQKIIDINLSAVYSCIQESVKLMKINGDQGKIITIGSVASHWSERGGDGSYTASKFGVHGMTESIARQLENYLFSNNIPIEQFVVDRGRMDEVFRELTTEDRKTLG